MAPRLHVWPYTEVADFVTETGYFDTLAYGVWYGTFEDHYHVSLFIYFYLVLGMSSFGTACNVVDSFGWFIDMPRLCRKLVSGKLGRSDYNVTKYDSCSR